MKKSVLLSIVLISTLLSFSQQASPPIFSVTQLNTSIKFRHTDSSVTLIPCQSVASIVSNPYPSNIISLWVSQQGEYEKIMQFDYSTCGFVSKSAAYDSLTLWSNCDTSAGSGGGGSGSVTDFIFTNGNGFTGTVGTSTTTPTLSLVADTLTKFASVDRVLDSLIDVNARIKNGDSIYFFRTFAQAKAEMTAHTLKKGASYQMAFQSVYDQPDFHANGTPKDTVVTKTGSVEHLVFVATSDSTFADAVSSIEYPNDKIEFDWTFTTTEIMDATAKGRISYREDENENICYYDFRKVLFLRYETSSGSGVFTSFKDNGETSAEYLTFGNSYGSIPIIKNKIARNISAFSDALFSYPFLLSNNVFQFESLGLGNSIAEISCNNTIGDGSGIQGLGSMYGNIVGVDASVKFQGLAINNIIGNQNSTIEFKGNAQNNIIGNLNQHIGFGVATYSISIGDSNDNVYFENSCDSINLGDNNDNIYFGNFCANLNWVSSATDLTGLRNIVFADGIDGFGWSNYITTILHPEMYIAYPKSVIKTPNGNVYTRYLNNALTDAITIID